MTDLLLGQLAAKVLVLVAVFACGSKQNPEQSCWKLLFFDGFLFPSLSLTATGIY